MKQANLEEIHRVYNKIKSDIEGRIAEFRKLLEENDHIKIFKEFIFCLLTPQSNAKVCWNAVERMFENNRIFSMSVDEIAMNLRGIRFKYTKAERIVLAIKSFFSEDEFVLLDSLKKMGSLERREFLVRNVMGYGYKEASHFLRNISLGLDLAILDRHILRNLLRYGVIENIPRSLTRKNYLLIENKMKKFADEISIDLAHLDFVFWYMETGEIFK